MSVTALWENRSRSVNPRIPICLFIILAVTSENYLNHPTFGLLYRICIVEENQELFTTLYAQRVFFLVSNNPNGLSFQPVTRADARLTIDTRIRLLRRNGQILEYQELQSMMQQNFPG